MVVKCFAVVIVAFAFLLSNILSNELNEEQLENFAADKK